jgi:hypothetical protein
MKLTQLPDDLARTLSRFHGERVPLEALRHRLREARGEPEALHAIRGRVDPPPVTCAEATPDAGPDAARALLAGELAYALPSADGGAEEAGYTLEHGVAVVSIVGSLLSGGGWYWDGYESIATRVEHAHCGATARRERDDEVARARGYVIAFDRLEAIGRDLHEVRTFAQPLHREGSVAADRAAERRLRSLGIHRDLHRAERPARRVKAAFDR